MPRIGGLVVLLASVLAAAALAPPAGAAPGPLLRALFGPTLVRAELIVQEGTGVRELRVDRGRVRVLADRQLRLLERDGTSVTVPVAADASITMRSARAPFSVLRTGMNVTTVRDRDQPAAYVVQPAQAWPRELARLLFGRLVIRAEVVIKDGSLRDIRVDHGQIVALRQRVIRIREADGRLVSFSVSTSATIRLDGRKAAWAWLRAGMTATVMREGDDGPASLVEASASG